jgi:hypothetical protein
LLAGIISLILSPSESGDQSENLLVEFAQLSRIQPIVEHLLEHGVATLILARMAFASLTRNLVSESLLD